MEALPPDWTTVLALVLLMGVRHGFDADHLATIDGLARWNGSLGRRWVQSACGVLFSLGHGAVVLVLAVASAALAQRWEPPHWLTLSGAWVSIGMLLALGLLNLQAVLSTPPGQVVQARGLKGRWLGGLAHTRHPLGIALIGALFAVSFDTVSLAALFSVTAARFGGWPQALLLGGLFTLGMLIADGLNGLCISRLVRRADRSGAVASRVMALGLSGLSLLAAAYGLWRLFGPAVQVDDESLALAVGVVVLLLPLAAFWLALRRARLSSPTAHGLG